MRRKLGKLHTWLGLLCAPYLVIFGFSSLHFNHQFGFVDAGERVVEWEQAVAVSDTSDDGALAARVRDDLSLPGWIPWWLYDRGEDNTFSFNVNRPGKQYRITVDPRRTTASVVETRNGPLQVVNSLHALGGVPGLGFTGAWSWYTYLSVFFVVFAGSTGVWFWSRRREGKLAGWIVLLGVTGGSLLLMLIVRVWG